ncbi:hypothetical protein [Parerythrobacter aestuarii]|uniref:hypothetical protein n=1 Tax=Parerythrobacter aestuarii TaxID=3020909 RepID=UPI0024DE737B|nr:hypothetical protein [Parerythrobacter aestuarii]
MNASSISRLTKIGLFLGWAFANYWWKEFATQEKLSDWLELAGFIFLGVIWLWSSRRVAELTWTGNGEKPIIP